LVIYYPFKVKPSFCVVKLCYLGNYHGMIVNYHGMIVNYHAMVGNYHGICVINIIKYNLINVAVQYCSMAVNYHSILTLGKVGLKLL